MRKDGRLVKNVPAMYAVAPYFMIHRYDAQNMIEVNIPFDPMAHYIHEKRAEGVEISYLALVIAAFLRTTAEFPYLNRFVVNKKIYARNEFSVGMVVLKTGDLDGTMNKMKFELEDDVFTVQRKITEYVEANRVQGDTNDTDRIINILLKIPGLISFGTALLRFWDLHFGLPKAIVDASPFHETMVITNLSSIRTNYIYHHVYEFGTTSMIAAMGNTVEVPKRIKGEIVHEKCMPIGLVMDERICSGTYYARAFNRVSVYLKDPRLLEGPPKVVNHDETY